MQANSTIFDILKHGALMTYNDEAKTLVACNGLYFDTYRLECDGTFKLIHTKVIDPDKDIHGQSRQYLFEVLTRHL